MVLPMVPYAEALPLYGLVLPILISVGVTPTTVWASATPPASPRMARPTARARNRLDTLMLSSRSLWGGVRRARHGAEPITGVSPWQLPDGSSGSTPGGRIPRSRAA